MWSKEEIDLKKLKKDIDELGAAAVKLMTQHHEYRSVLEKININKNVLEIHCAGIKHRQKFTANAFVPHRNSNAFISVTMHAKFTTITKGKHIYIGCANADTITITKNK